MQHRMNLNYFNISKYRTLFLDRDGVINRRLIDDYVKRWEEFEFLPGTLEALKIFADYLDTILVVTNQQGVGKGLMKQEGVEAIHEKMINIVHREGGRIDRVYYCPGLAEANPLCRKPEPGMALQAKDDFPGIDFEKSIMVGDSISDMKFGRRLKMLCVLISDEEKDTYWHSDIIFPDLVTFAKYLELRIKTKA